MPNHTPQEQVASRSGGPNASSQLSSGADIGARINSLTAASLPSHRPQLPVEVQELVDRALSAGRDYAEFSKAIEKLAQRGGMDSAHGLSRVLEAVIGHEVNPGAFAPSEQHLPIYSVCSALLKISKSSRDPGLTPLNRAQSGEVIALVKALALGDHGDTQISHGARAALFERANENPIKNAVISSILNTCWFFRGEEACIRMVHILTDLPWAFRSKLGFASYRNRVSNNLRAVLERLHDRERK